MINKVLEQYKKSKQASYEALQARCNELELSNRKLKQECEELRNKERKLYKFLKKTYNWGHNDVWIRNYLLHYLFGERDHTDCVADRLKNNLQNYKQGLDEIEQHFEHRCKICREEYEFYASCDVCWKKQILEIISKAKGGKNAR